MLRKKYRLRVFENSNLRKIIGSKGDEDGQRKRPHCKELNTLYRSLKLIRVYENERLAWAGHKKVWALSKILTGITAEESPVGSCTNSWKKILGKISNNQKMN